MRGLFYVQNLNVSYLNFFIDTKCKFANTESHQGSITIRALQLDGSLSNFNLGGWIQYGGRGGLAEAERGLYMECP